MLQVRENEISLRK